MPLIFYFILKRGLLITLTIQIKIDGIMNVFSHWIKNDIYNNYFIDRGEKVLYP